MSENVLLIECKDEKGLISRATGVLYDSDCNIISNGEFVDRERNRFFMRTEFSGDFQKEKLQSKFEKALPDDSIIRIADKEKKKIVIMATKEHHCLAELLYRYVYKELNASVVAVISNYDKLKPLADNFKIPFVHVSHDGISRSEHEDAVCKALNAYDFDYIILAKYMRILSPEFVMKYRNKILNIHHSFLPAFIGANPYRQAYERGVKIIGATAHFVNENLDAGPIISQSVIPVNHADSADEMCRAGRDVERLVLANALNLVLEDRVFVNGGKTVIFN